jgi:hypothetical protein
MLKQHLIAAALGGVLLLPAAGAEEPPRSTDDAAETGLFAPLDDDILGALAESVGSYELAAGETLREGLARWCTDAGWTLVWRASRDYRVDANLRFPAGTSLREAVKQAVRAVWLHNPAIKATVYKNQVIVITEGTL